MSLPAPLKTLAFLGLSAAALRAQILPDPTPFPLPLRIRTLVLEQDLGTHKDLWAMNELGGPPKVLAQSPIHEEQFFGTLGGRILYYRWPYGMVGQNRELWSVKPDGTGAILLASGINSALKMPPPEIDAKRGQVLLIHTLPDGRPELLSVLPDGSGRRVLLQGTSNLPWRRGWIELEKIVDGKLFVQSHYSDTDIDLQWLDVDTGVSHSLATSGNHEFFNALDPSTGSVYYQLMAGGHLDLWAVQLDGGGRRPVGARADVEERCVAAQGGRVLVAEEFLDPESREVLPLGIYACDSAGGSHQTIWSDRNFPALNPRFTSPDVVAFSLGSIATTTGHGPYFYNLRTGTTRTWPVTWDTRNPPPSLRDGSADRLLVEMSDGGPGRHPTLWSVRVDGSSPQVLEFPSHGREEAIQNGRLYYSSGIDLGQIWHMGLGGETPTPVVNAISQAHVGVILGDSLFHTSTNPATGSTLVYRTGATNLETPRKLRTLLGSYRIVGSL